MLAVPACYRYWHDALNQSWVNFGPLSVMPAHIQRGAKHNTLTNTGLLLAQRRGQWAIISPALGQRLMFDCLPDRKRWTD